MRWLSTWPDTEGLFALVETVICEDPFTGHLFRIRNQRRDWLMLLWWNRDVLDIVLKTAEVWELRVPDGSNDEQSLP